MVDRLNKLQDDLMSILECPVCMEIMKNPILQCLGGHSFCSNCIKQFTECPVCTISVRNSVRNFSLEKLSKQLTNPCPNQKHGCQESVVGWEDPHEISCPFGKDVCPTPQDMDKICSCKGRNKRTLEHDTQGDRQNPKRSAGLPDQRPSVSCPHGDHENSIPQCSSGHSSCSDCIKQVTQRPVCGTSVSDPVVSYSLEKISEQAKNNKHDFQERVSGKKFAHENGCPFQVKDCPISRDMDTECFWSGRNIHILNHVRKHHPQNIFNLEEGTKYFKYECKEGSLHHVYLMHLKNDLFVCYDHYEKRQEKFCMAVQYLGANENASNFVYNITISSQNHARKIVYSRKVHTEDEDIQTLCGTDDCFTITEEQLQLFKPSNETYKFYNGWNIIRV